MIPSFVHHPGATSYYSYLLPPGLHHCSLSDIEGTLVTPFTTSTARRAIGDGLKRYIADLESHGISGRMWLDGSFVTSKNHPGDIDVVSFVSSDLLNRLLPIGQSFALDMLNAKEATKPGYNVHSFSVTCVPVSHPLYVAQSQNAKFWKNFFGHTRPLLMPGGQEIKLAKGMLSLPFGDAAETSIIDNWLSNLI